MTHIAPAPAYDEAEVEDLLATIDETPDESSRARLREQVVARALSVADGIAHRYAGRGIDVEDLEQVARCALVAAVNRYRCDAGPGFLAFAVPTITGELKRHFRDCGWAVRPPRRLQELRSELLVAEEELRHELTRDPTTDELCERLGVDPDDVREARACGGGFRVTSLDAPTAQGGTVGERFAGADDPHGAVETHLVLSALIAELDERDRTILGMRYVEGRTQREIGAVIGVSQMQVSRVLTRIHRRLHHGLVAA